MWNSNEQGKNLFVLLGKNKFQEIEMQKLW